MQIDFAKAFDSVDHETLWTVVELYGIHGQTLDALRASYEEVRMRVKDGIIDASEVAAVVDELVKEQALQRVYKFVAIGLFIVVIVLIGALTGITWAIVQLSKETKVCAPCGT
ncbi:hypothetical protein GPECTOR_12g357 [Gonium pectorale]|uniref:Reverse transcriptase domain-containing protein n=1 Tax=Gonium pectorale TaxID=33097 RepID=A0A150GNP3_GONPE|nr:hypothetical protein GPECTOR_12g357 [Gonium pectorale]|eukprot:KXZ51395.1 hypothetical protein GPECTOR_12g357 [Gonium pectorale]